MNTLKFKFILQPITSFIDTNHYEDNEVTFKGKLITKNKKITKKT
jgi:hypothetical protein